MAFPSIRNPFSPGETVMPQPDRQQTGDPLDQQDAAQQDQPLQDQAEPAYTTALQPPTAAPVVQPGRFNAAQVNNPYYQAANQGLIRQQAMEDRQAQQQQVYAQRVAAQQAKEAERQQKEEQRQQVLAANSQTLAQYQAEGRPHYIDPATKLVVPKHDDETWNALKEQRQVNDQLRQQYWQQGRQFTFDREDPAHAIIPKQSDEDWQTELEKRALTSQLHKLTAETSGNPDRAYLPDTKRAGLEKQLAKDTRAAVDLHLAPDLTKASQATSGGVLGFGSSPTPDATAAKTRLDDLIQRSTPDPNDSEAMKKPVELNDQDLADLAKANPTLHQRITTTQQQLARDAENRAWHDEKKAQASDLKQRIADPVAWRAAQMQTIGELTSPEQAAQHLDRLSAGFQTRLQDFQQRQQALAAEQQSFNAQHDQIAAQNEQEVAKGLAPDKIVTLADGSTWHKDLFQQAQALAHQAQAWQNKRQPDMALLHADATALQAEGSVLNAAAKHTQNLQTQQQQEEFAKLKLNPSYAPFADQMTALQKDVQKRQEALSQYGEDTPERQAAQQALQDDFATQSQAISEGMAAKKQAGADLYTALKGNADAPDLAEKAQAAGLSPEEGKYWIHNFKAFDFNQGNKEDPIRKDLEGNLAINPSLYTKPEEARKAIEASDATPAAKKQALDALPQLEQEGYKAVVPMLAGKGMGFDDFALKHHAAVLVPGMIDLSGMSTSEQDRADLLAKSDFKNEAELVKAYMAEHKGVAGFVQTQLKQALSGVVQGTVSMLQQGAAITGAVTGSQRAMDLSSGINKDMGGLGQASALLPSGQWTQQLAQGGMSILPAMVGGLATGIVGRLAIAGKLATLAPEAASALATRVIGGASLAGSAGAAGLQTFGQTFGQAFDAYKAQGLTRDEAMQKSWLPAIGSGLSTAIVTAIGGHGEFGGVENLAASEAARGLVKNTATSFLKGILKGAAGEFTEESVDQFVQGIIARHTFEPEKSWKEIIDDALQAGVMGAVLGGASHAVQHVDEHHAATYEEARAAAFAQAQDRWRKSPEAQAAAQTQIEGWFKPGLSPEQVAATQDAAHALLAVAHGQTENLNDAQLALIDLKREGGTLKEDKPKDRPARVTLDEQGNPIISQPTLDNLQREMPAAHALIGMSESEARQYFQAKAQQAKAAEATKNNQPTGGTSDAPDLRSQEGRQGQQGRQGRNEGLLSPDSTRTTPAPGEESPGALDRHRALSDTEQQRIEHLTNFLTEREVDPEHAKTFATAYVRDQGISEADTGVDGPKLVRWMNTFGGGVKARKQGNARAAQAVQDFMKMGAKASAPVVSKSEVSKSVTDTPTNGRTDAPASLTEQPDYAEARRAAIAGITGANPLEQGTKRKAAVKALTTLEQHVSRYGALFPGGVRLADEKTDSHMLGSSGGMWADPHGGKPQLVVDLKAFLNSYGDHADPRAIQSVVEEELIHRVTLEQFKPAELRKFWSELPADIQNHVWNGYHAQAISDAQKPGTVPALSENEQANMAHEFLRMLVQDSTFRQRVTESQDINPTLKQKVVEFLKNLVKGLRDLISKAPTEIKAQIQAYEVRTSKALKELLQTLPENSPAGSSEAKLKAQKTTSAGDLGATGPSKLTPSAEGAKPHPIIKDAVTGSEGTAYTDQNEPIGYKWAVVEAGDLVTSNHDTGGVNLHYPQEFQPRDRSSAGSQAQVQDIANNSNLDRLSQSNLVSDGAPIIGEDAVVESGNGRVMGIRRGYEQKRDSTEAYKTKLTQRAAEFGLDSAKVQKMKRPVLVRLRTTPLSTEQRVAFSQAANVSTVAPMREGEVARKDAKNLTPALLSQFQADDQANFLHPANADFIRAFVRDVIPPSERAAAVDAQGNLSQSGVRRVRNALFAAAYGDSAASMALLTRLSESTDDSGRNLVSALFAAAPVFAEQKARMEDGALQPALDITEDITAAVSKLFDLQAEGTRVADFLAQDQIPGIGQDMPPVQRAILSFLEANQRSAKRLKDTFARYQSAVEGAGDPRQGALFGDTQQDKTALWTLAATYQEPLGTAQKRIAYNPDQLGLFDARPQPQQQAKPAEPDSTEIRLQKSYGSGATLDYKPSRSLRDFYGVDSVPFHVTNNIPVPEGRKLVAAQVTQLNDKGSPTLYRISVIQNEDGTQYSQVERHVEHQGSFSNIVGAFHLMSEYDIERNRSLNDKARALWDSAQREIGQTSLFSAPKRSILDRIRGLFTGQTSAPASSIENPASSPTDTPTNGRTESPAFEVAFHPASPTLNGDLSPTASPAETFDSLARAVGAGSERAVQEDGRQVDRRQRASESIGSWARANGKLIQRDDLARRVRKWIDDKKQLTSGQEHDVYADGASGRVIKVTKEGDYGAQGIERYLANLQRSNAELGDDIQIVGVVQNAKSGWHHIVISQPFYKGRSATDAEISQHMASRGYARVSNTTYYNPSIGDANSDARPANVIMGDDGQVHPFDVQFFTPTPTMLDQMENVMNANPWGNMLGSAPKRSTPLEGLDAPQAAKVYRRLFKLQQQGETLNAGQVQAMERAERRLGQQFMFDDVRSRKPAEDLYLTAPAEPTWQGEQLTLLSGRKRTPEDGYVNFPDSSGSLGIPRAEMPQVPTDARGALANYLSARGITSTPETVDASTLKPTQAEYSPEKVEKSKQHQAERRLLVSSDGYVLDGHHQLVAASGGPVDIMRLSMSVREALSALDAFPSTTGGTPSNTRYATEEYPYLGTAGEDWKTASHPEASIVNPIDPTLTPDAKVDALNKLSRDNVPAVRAILADLKAKLKLDGKFSVKLPERIQAKASRPSIRAEKPWHDIEHIRDGLRFKVSLNHFNHAPAITRILQQHGASIIKLDTKKMVSPKEWGWRFIAWDIQMPNGQLVEFYAPLPELDDKAVKGPNHHLFEKWRNVPEEAIINDESLFNERAQDIATSQGRYNDAFRRAITRMGYSDERAAAASWAKVSAALESLKGSNFSIPSTAEKVPLLQTPSSERRMGGKAEESTTSSTLPASSFQTDTFKSEPDSFTVEDSTDSDGGQQQALFSSRKRGGQNDANQLGLFDLLTPAQVQSKLAEPSLFGNDFQPAIRPQRSRPTGTAGTAKPAQSASSLGELFAQPNAAGSSQQPTGQPRKPGRSGGGQSGITGDLFDAGLADTGTSGAGSSSSGPTAPTGSGTGAKPRPAQSQRIERPAPDSPERNYSGYPGFPSGARAKIAANLEAITLLKQLEQEGRNPTSDEKETLAKYVGWGAFKEGFNHKNGEAYDNYWKNADAWRRSQYMPDYLSSWVKNHYDTYQALKEAMKPDEFAAAARSTLNAHYTDPAIIRSMWDMARKLGFRGGSVLEPAAGSGFFVASQPADLANATRWSAVELDDLTARLFSKLYPEATINEHFSNPAREVSGLGFERARIPDHSQDLIISNVPFFESGPPDDRYPLALNLHNYFFARALDKVKPGGLVMFITSSSTMQNNIAQRKFLASKGDLVAAYRLPNSAFKANAGTEVTTDILIMRKPDGNGFQGENWQSLVEAGRQTVTMVQGRDQLADDFRRQAKATGNVIKETRRSDGKLTAEVDAPIMVNEYFAAHPENVIGRHALAGSMYKANEYTVESDGTVVPTRLSELAQSLPRLIGQGTTPTLDTTGNSLANYTEKPYSYVERDGKPWFVKADRTLEKPVWQDDAKTVRLWKSWKNIADAVRNLVQAENNPKSDDGTLDALRATLNRFYDRHVADNGALTKRGRNVHAPFSDDPDFPLTAALEDEKKTPDPNNPKKTRYTYQKALIFNERIIKPTAPPTTADNPQDALHASLGWQSRIDVPWIADLLGTDETSAKAQLLTLPNVFENPGTGMLEPQDRYLSGNVRQKLAEAEAAALENPAMQKNVEALRAAQPAHVPIGGLPVNLGERWIPGSIYEAFAREKLQATNARFRYNAIGNEWTVETYGRNAEFNTDHMNAGEIMDAVMNSREPAVYTGTGKDRAFSPSATALAKSTATKIARAFEEFVRTSETMVGDKPIWQHVEDTFNKTQNSYVTPTYSGEHLAFPGLSEDVYRTPHRRAVIARFLSERHGMMAHGVGSGKTFNQIVLAQEMRRLGLAKAPMIVVQNSTLGQFAASYRRAYPNAKILVGDDSTFAKDKRREFVSRMVTGDYDAIILPHSQFSMIPHKPDVLKRYIGDQIAELEDLIEQEKSEGANVRDLEGMKLRLEQRLQKMLDKLEARQDNTLFWEDLGIDALIVDEAHKFKSVPIITRKSRIKGIPAGVDSQAGIGMLLKARSVQARTGGKNVFLATGTPIKNTMAEAYIMTMLASPHVLDDYNIKNFDDFANTYGREVSSTEISWGTQPKVESRFAKFIKGAQLITMIRSSFDVAMGNEKLGLKVPEIKGGAPEMLILPASDNMKAFNVFVRDVAREFAATSANEREEKGYGAVPIMTLQAGIAAALDTRLISPAAADEAASKVNTAVQRIMAIYKAGKEHNSTQAVFSDLQKPFDLSYLWRFADAKGIKRPFPTSYDSTFNIYDDLKQKLITAGIPASEIAVVGANVSKEKRGGIFDAVDEGKIRIIIGSTETIGVGANYQSRLKAVHHLMPPRDMTPAMMEQRNGRIIRQGNLHYQWGEPVEIVNYGVEGTMDSAIYGTLARKQRFITQLLMGENISTEFDDPADPIAINMAEMAARTMGDPDFIRRVELEKILNEMRAERQGFLNEQASKKRKLYLDRQFAEQHGPNALQGLVNLQTKYSNLFTRTAPAPEGVTADVSEKPIYTFGERTVDTAAKEGSKIVEPLDVWMAAQSVALERRGRSSEEQTITVNGVPVVIRIDRTIPGVATGGAVVEPAPINGSSSFNGAASLIHRLRGIVSDMPKAAAQLSQQIANAKQSVASTEAALTKGSRYEREDEFQKAEQELQQVDARLAEKSKPPEANAAIPTTDAPVASAPKRGRAQPARELIRSAGGTVPMGTLVRGDSITGPDQQPQTITAVHPQGEQRVFRLTLDAAPSSLIPHPSSLFSEDHLFIARLDSPTSPALNLRLAEIAAIMDSGRRVFLPHVGN
jgi:N12 class adenine-specific DNA methylase